VSTDRLLADLLDASHLFPPDALASEVATRAAREGLGDVCIYLIDYEQARLVPLDGAGSPAGPVPIDGTLMGRAFVTETVVTSTANGGQRLWVPILDGGDRLGVLGVTVAENDAGKRHGCETLASLVALLLVSKRAYTDVYEMQRRSREFDLAAELQLQLLPPLTFIHPMLGIAGVLENAYETGGDAFDYAVDGNRAYFAVFDAMGHGLSASLLAASVVGAYRNCRRRRHDLAQTFAVLESVVAAQPVRGEQFVTTQLGELDIDTGAFSWINGGHPLPLVVRDGRSVGRLECKPTLPLGLDGSLAEIATDRLGPGDRLLFFSDGVVEAKAGDGEPFGEERLMDLLGRVSLAGLRPAETMRRLLHAVLAHQGASLVDDASMVLIEWNPPPASPVVTTDD
jgi:serine phosphatase RsbU (regulator of sigma subunit)